MKILGLGVPELLIILVVILLIFGPKNLPKLGNALGRTVKSLREGMGSGKKDVEDASDEPKEAEQTEEASETVETVEEVSAEGAPTKKVKRVVKKKAE